MINHPANPLLPASIRHLIDYVGPIYIIETTAHLLFRPKFQNSSNSDFKQTGKARKFAIPNPAELETQKREIVPESVQIDTVVTFPDDFDFMTLQDRIFPFWGRENVVEYKGERDKLSAMHVYQYSLTELGILTTHFLSKIREDRAERQPLSQQAAKTNNDYFILDLMEERYGDDRSVFLQNIFTALRKNDSPTEVAQTMLQVDSPEEAALNFIQTEEQAERLLELVRQRNLERSEA